MKRPKGMARKMSTTLQIWTECGQPVSTSSIHTSASKQSKLVQTFMLFASRHAKAPANRPASCVSTLSGSRDARRPASRSWLQIKPTAASRTVAKWTVPI
eukprot:scaffold20093_cov63-Phaeocystis_antarctica.AAC.3